MSMYQANCITVDIKIVYLLAPSFLPSFLSFFPYDNFILLVSLFKNK